MHVDYLVCDLRRSGSLWAFNPQQPTSAYQSISPAGDITGLTCLSIGLCLYAERR